ncbi:hypothetical protein DICPUDRAFT_74293 [Dictyostelium purpureum]|uniref:Uncharacterized protein n=1 Tax=Dictyostelium purpureum TaxID=5786 RepID=F0Z7B4_DICPU|nr:uncharacterized protein DICPUDRAFT_74293 [Dictyostelium purpureum]EGC40148.1 hypothetical protein DICPUDRAFT_74293 [Dictyostelium purpureum]|eukprot:XP_003283338.1 hypothetical protein DICPUDRAFT_74293 [Dictyostelium purpureum]
MNFIIKNLFLFSFLILLIFCNISTSNKINKKEENQNLKYNRYTSGYNFNGNEKDLNTHSSSTSGNAAISSSSGISSSGSGLSGSGGNNDNFEDYLSGSYTGASTSSTASVTGSYSTANHPAHDTGSGSSGGYLFAICLYCDENCQSYQKICVQATPRVCTPIMNPCTKSTIWVIGSNTQEVSIFTDFRCTVLNRIETIDQECSDCAIIQKFNTYVSSCRYAS